jgi:hypothetical protein
MSNEPTDSSSARESGAEHADQAVAALADLLHETEDHHGAYEPTAPKHNWWDWYAAYMYARQHGRSEEEAARDAGHHMERILGPST